MELSSSLRSLASIPVLQGVVGAARRAARAFSPELDLTTTERLTLAYITIRCGSAPIQGGRGHVCIARMREIAAATGRSLRTARYACRALEEKGYITSEIVERGGRLPVGFLADRETLVVRALRDLKATKVAGLNGAVCKAFSASLRGKDGGRLAASRRAVLAVLLIHAGDGGWCWPSYATIAAMTGLTDRTVGSAMRELVDCGHVMKRIIPPSWAEPTWQLKYRPTPTVLHMGTANPGKRSSPDALPGNSFLTPRQPLPTKEIREEDPLAAPVDPVQLDMFAPRTGRAAEVDAVMRAATMVDGVNVEPEHRARIQARLGEGALADDIVIALHVASQGPLPKRDLLTTVTRSKTVIASFLDKIGEGGRLRVLELGVMDVPADRQVRNDANDRADSHAMRSIKMGLAIQRPDFGMRKTI